MLTRLLKMLIFMPLRVQMSKSAVLGTPDWNIHNRDSITRVESSQIRQDLCKFGLPNQKADMNIKQSCNDSISCELKPRPKNASQACTFGSTRVPL